MREEIQVTKKFYRQGTSFARGTPIDEYISEDACELLYRNWDKGVKKYDWPPKLEFHGRIFSITGEMILATTGSQRQKIYGPNKTVKKLVAEFVTAALTYV